jgi:hypothetical protein
MISLLILVTLLLPLSAENLPIDHDVWEAQLDGAQVVPPVGTEGTAVVEIMYSFDHFEDPQRCDFSITYARLTGPPTGVTLRWGRQGENGPLAFMLVDGTFNSPYSGSVDVPWNVLGHFGGPDTLYVVISTDAYPDGEARGRFANVTPPAAERSSWGAIRGAFR